MRKYDFITASNGDVAVDEQGVEFEIFLSKAGAEKGYPILAVNQDQRLFVKLTLEGKCPVNPSFGSRSMVKQMNFCHKPEKKTGWVIISKFDENRPICKSMIFQTESDAKHYARTCNKQTFLGISEVTWEE